MEIPSRAAYSPGEFAELFGKSQTWGYRQIYAGTVSAITERGRILIPADEVDRLLMSAGIYNGRKKPSADKKLKTLSSAELSLWQKFVKERQREDAKSLQRVPKQKLSAAAPKPRWGSKSSSQVRQKIARTWANK